MHYEEYTNDVQYRINFRKGQTSSFEIKISGDDTIYNKDVDHGIFNLEEYTKDHDAYAIGIEGTYICVALQPVVLVI